MHFENEVNAVIADTAILSAQPTRLLLSGIFDALAKFVEIKQRYDENAADSPMGLDYACAISRHSFELLTGKTADCITDMENGSITPTVENVLFTAIAATGVISGIARGSNQCAIAHKFYETTRILYPEQSRPYLHGEIVGVGLLMQNHFNGEVGNNELLLNLMTRHGMPKCVADIGIDCTEETFEAYYEAIRNTSAVDKDDAEMCARFEASLRYLWK